MYAIHRSNGCFVNNTCITLSLDTRSPIQKTRRLIFCFSIISTTSASYYNVLSSLDGVLEVGPALVGVSGNVEKLLVLAVHVVTHGHDDTNSANVEAERGPKSENSGQYPITTLRTGCSPWDVSRCVGLSIHCGSDNTANTSETNDQSRRDCSLGRSKDVVLGVCEDTGDIVLTSGDTQERAKVPHSKGLGVCDNGQSDNGDGGAENEEGRSFLVLVTEDGADVGVDRGEDVWRGRQEERELDRVASTSKNDGQEEGDYDDQLCLKARGLVIDSQAYDPVVADMKR